MHSSRNPFTGAVPISQQQKSNSQNIAINQQQLKTKQQMHVFFNPQQIAQEFPYNNPTLQNNGIRQSYQQYCQIPVQNAQPIQLPKQFIANQNRFNQTLYINVDQRVAQFNRTQMHSAGKNRIINVQNGVNYIRYDDDDAIPQIREDAKQKNSYNLEQNISLEVKTQYKILMQNKQQYLPGIVSVKTNDIAQNAKIQRIGIDLICLIDVSSSMEGDKIQMVKSTLIKLLQFLTDKDRLQLILFNEAATRLTPLKRVTDSNRQYFKSKILEICASGGTFIASATEIAFQQLKQRRYRNNATSIFLLSDGQDYCEQAIAQQLKQINEVFTINTFGFGEDNDAEMMTTICNLKSGSFYFVQDIRLLDEFFADAIGGLISIVGQELQIILKCQPNQPFQDIKIHKTYGPMWRRLNQQYQILCPQIASGSRKDFVFELELPKTIQILRDYERSPLILEAELRVKCPTTRQIIVTNSVLHITFLNYDEQITSYIEDVDVAAQYYRVKSADIIDYAKKACADNQFEAAQRSITQMIAHIKNNPKVAELSAGIIQDLEQAKQGSQRQNYQAFGQKLMCQMASNNYQQQGVNSVFSAHGVQMQPLKQAVYQNKTQAQMVQAVQASKAQK